MSKKAFSPFPTCPGVPTRLLPGSHPSLVCPVLSQPGILLPPPSASRKHQAGDAGGPCSHSGQGWALPVTDQGIKKSAGYPILTYHRLVPGISVPHTLSRRPGVSLVFSGTEDHI